VQKPTTVDVKNDVMIRRQANSNQQLATQQQQLATQQHSNTATTATRISRRDGGQQRSQPGADHHTRPGGDQSSPAHWPNALEAQPAFG